ncbi:MAG: 5'-deoxynucleotidase [Eubacteriales bacterium]|nr:5'-deoxynucleotidase [Eubacteriales bacterium]
MIAFYAVLRRLRFIERWQLMRKFYPENVQEHSFEVAVLAHALALIRREILKLEGPEPEAVLAHAIFHDATECLTGDLPTPVKYYDQSLQQAYKELEKQAESRLLKLLPEPLQGAYSEAFEPQDLELKRIVKQADTLSAYLKAREELAAGNQEFAQAVKSIAAKLEERSSPELEYFLEECLPAFAKNLDELNESSGEITF